MTDRQPEQPPQQDPPNLQVILTEARQIVTTFTEGVKSLHEALHGQSTSVSTAYLAKRMEVIDETQAKMQSDLRAIEAAVNGISARMDKAAAVIGPLLKGQTK